MGLLDSVVGSVLGHAAGGTPGAGLGPLASVLGPMLASTNNPLGGLPGLLHRFEQGGLGHLAASWVGTGPNLPVSGAQVHDALGGELLAGLATRLGMDPAQLQTLLAQWLPVLVDKLTPQGVVPADGAASGTSQDLLASLGSLLQKK